jgi:hypothetical protein
MQAEVLERVTKAGDGAERAACRTRTCWTQAHNSENAYQATRVAQRYDAVCMSLYLESRGYYSPESTRR